jgi:hypothetical protein
VFGLRALIVQDEVSLRPMMLPIGRHAVRTDRPLE